MLDARYRRDNFGIDYVSVMASAIGLVVHRYDVDSTGVDLGLRLDGRTKHTMSPGIDVRVVSWADSRQEGGDWRFDGLTETQFNRLAGPDFLYPRYLFLVSLPERPGDYARVWSDSMVLRQLGYYTSLAAERRIRLPDASRRRTILVPLTKALSERTLYKLIESAEACR